MSLGCPWAGPGPTSLVPGGHLGCPKLIFEYLFEIFVFAVATMIVWLLVNGMLVAIIYNIG
jgi:hypothetical protein